MARSHGSTTPLFVGAATGRLDEGRVVAALAGLWDEPRRTWERGVARVPPGWVVVGDRWSRLPLPAADGTIGGLRDALARAVARRRPPGVVATTLSGGLDSAAVTALAALEGPVVPFTATFRGFPDADETDRARRAAPRAPVEVACAGLNQWSDRRPDPDGPDLGVNHGIHAAIARAAAGHGHRVILGGSGGDYVLGHGWPALTGLSRRGRWLAAARLVDRLVRHGHGGDRRSVWTTWVVRPWAPPSARRRARGRDVRLVPPWVRATVAKQWSLEERLAASWARWADPARDARDENLRLWEDPGHALLMEGLVGVCAREGLDLRLPLLDAEVVAESLALPEEVRLLGGHPRGAFREALRGVLPDSVRLSSGKANFSRWSAASMRRDPALGIALADVARLETWVDPRSLAAEVERFLHGDDTRWRAAALVGALVPWLGRTKLGG